MWGRTKQGRQSWIGRGVLGGVGVGGAASIVAMRKQSNTNWSHSRGTAGAHRGDSLGGPTARKGERKREERNMPRSFAREMETLKIGAIKERAAPGRTGEKKRGGERLEGSSYSYPPPFIPVITAS